MVKISQFKKQAENLNRHIHTPKNEILSYVTWVDLMGIMLSEISQRDKDKYEFIYVELKKKNAQRHREWTGYCWRGGV